tara:strand:+ start:163 stop:435 length:273 start_codon:yes stop_codon:yes gene_type:complete
MKWIKQKLWLMKFRWISFKTGPMPWSKPRRWHRRNRWFGGGSEQEKLMTMTAYGLHSEAINMGLDAEDQLYYDYLDGHMRERFPEYPWKS